MKRRVQWFFLVVSAVLGLSVILEAQLWVSGASGISTSGTVAVTNSTSSALTVTGGADIGGVIQAGSGNINLTNSTGNLLEASIADGSIYTRNAGTETVSGNWTFSSADTQAAAMTFTGIGAAAPGKIGFLSNQLAFVGGSGGHGFYNSGGGLTTSVDASGNWSLTGRINSVTAQPGFLAFNGATDSGLSNGATVQVDGEAYDNANNFASNSFTAPVTGHYALCANAEIQTSGAIANVALNIVTSNRSYQVGATVHPSATTNSTFDGCVVADMDASDTASLTVSLSTGTATVLGGTSTSGATVTYFSGRLVP